MEKHKIKVKSDMSQANDITTRNEGIGPARQ
jgi:hypothetical protein